MTPLPHTVIVPANTTCSTLIQLKQKKTHFAYQILRFDLIFKDIISNSFCLQGKNAHAPRNTHTHSQSIHKAIIAQKYPPFSNYRIFPLQNSSQFEKPELWIVSPTVGNQMVAKKLFTGTSCNWHQSVISSPQVRTFLMVQPKAENFIRYDCITNISSNKCIATEVKHRMSQSISVYVVTAHRNGYKTNCTIDPLLPTNTGPVDHD